MAMAVSKAKLIPRWPAAMATSLGLHLAVLLLAISEAPRRPKDPMIEVEVLPVRLEVPAPIPTPVLADPVPRGAEVAGRRRGPVMSRLVVSRPRPVGNTAGNPEAPPAEHAPEAAAAPGPASAESVIVAKAAAAPSEGAGPNPGPVVAGPRVGLPKTVAPAVGDGLLAINPNDPHYQPTIPQPLRKPGVSFLSRLKFCVASDGSVDKVTVVTSSDPALDNAILEKARLYRFHPYFDQGRPIPFCFYREYRLSIRE
jgi:outer membrane biosynthesis protein TonB